LAIAVVLFAAYALFTFEPLTISGFGDAREKIFGRDLRYLLFAGFVAFIFLVVRLIDSFVFDFVFSRQRHIIAPMLLREIVSITLYVLAFAAAISTIFHKNVSALLTGGAVLAAVIGLALQDTLGNLFSGISLHLEHSFEVGDVVRSGDYIGLIEGVNWRATRLRTFNNNIVILPNAVIARERLEVFPKDNLNARIVTVGASYEVPPAKVLEVLEQAAANVPGVASDIPVMARIGGFADSSITYEVKYWTRIYHQRDLIDAEIRRAIWYAFKRNGIAIPLPIRTILHADQGGPKASVDEREVLARINSVDILAPLSNEEQRALAKSTKVHMYSRGETIIRHSQDGDSMFIVDEGTVSIRIPTDHGSNEVAQLGAGSIFGEMALLTGESRTADVVAMTDVVALEIDKPALKLVLDEDPDLAAALSAKVGERRKAMMASTQSDADDDVSLLDRIRSYFGLGR
jgi:Small-conductance mechanosensitive channel